MKTSSGQFPARLRLRFPQLRHAPLAAAEVASAMRTLDGIVSVEASPLTGSMLVTYSVGGEHEARLWPALRKVLAEHGLSGESHHGAAAPSGGAEKLAGVLVDKLVERSALALVAALL